MLNQKKWIENYHRAPKDPFRSNANTIKCRLSYLEVIKLPRHSNILDLGCGDGETMQYLYKEGFSNIYGVEYSFANLTLAPFRGKVPNADGCILPFRSESFDCVYIIGVLHHLPNPTAVLSLAKEVQRVLKSNGTLSFCEPAPTIWRKILTPLLLSPLGGVTRYTRTKRVTVLEEWPEISNWLNNYCQNIELIVRQFSVLKEKKGILKSFYVMAPRK
jgi:ubiquinone/menaquinone biosynthesis C-methylase UbiE